MKFPKIISDFLVIFVITLVVSAAITFLFSYFFHENGAVNWETSFRMAIILGLIIPWIHHREKKHREKGS
jgi:hypothetical protein